MSSAALTQWDFQRCNRWYFPVSCSTDNDSRLRRRRHLLTNV